MPRVDLPGMHGRALGFIELVQGCHLAGSGRIALLDLARLFGVELNAQQTSILTRRGDVVLESEENSYGVFQNTGTASHFSHGVTTLTTPPLIAGRYVTDADRCYFRFDPSHTIVGSAYLIFSSNLKSVYVDREIIKIKMEDPEFNQVINHQPIKSAV